MTDPTDHSFAAVRLGDPEDVDWILTEIKDSELGPIKSVYISYPAGVKTDLRSMSINFDRDTGTLVFDAGGWDYDADGIWESFYDVLESVPVTVGPD